VPAIVYLLTIKIGMDPNIAKFGSLQLTWHGIFTAVGIAAGVYLGAWLGRRQGITEDDAYSVALVGVPAGIIGARAMYVLENHARFSGHWVDVLRINEGGITVYGAVIGGVIGAVAYGLIRKLPITRGLDAAGFGLLLGMGVGRIGDLINGEHWADQTDLPWAFRYTNPNTLGEIGKAVHPTAGGYELLGDLIILGLLVFVFRRFVRTPGWVFCIYVGLYGAMRFALSYTRTNEQEISGIPVPQLVAGITIGLAIVAASVLMRWPGPITPEYANRVWGDRPDDTDAKGAATPA